MSENNIVSIVTPDNELVPSGPGVVAEKLADAMTPGYVAEFDPDEAEQAGAFIEDALTEEDAIESATDAADEE
jgi:hypothetical protein